LEATFCQQFTSHIGWTPGANSWQ